MVMAAPVVVFFFFQAEDGIRDKLVTGVQTCALPILRRWAFWCRTEFSSATGSPPGSCRWRRRARRRQIGRGAGRGRGEISVGARSFKKKKKKRPSKTPIDSIVKHNR